ncbi:hypothetical protein CCP3SC1AL1_350014 [Gammaproteobacteria bacterium]
MKLTNHDKVLIGLFVALAIAIFFLGRCSKKVIEPIIQTDISKYEMKIDSLANSNKSLTVKNIYLLLKYDSLESKKVINHKKTASEINKIKFFTPDSRIKWNDSVLTAEGLK